MDYERQQLLAENKDLRNDIAQLTARAEQAESKVKELQAFVKQCTSTEIGKQIKRAEAAEAEVERLRRAYNDSFVAGRYEALEAENARLRERVAELAASIEQHECMATAYEEALDKAHVESDAYARGE